MRWLDEDDHVSEFRMPSNNSNGNSLDRSGRQLSAEHLARRVMRYEHDGSVTILADMFEGKRFNSQTTSSNIPIAASGSPIRPMAASCMRCPGCAGGPSNAASLLNPRLGQPPEFGDYVREVETATYRIGTDGGSPACQPKPMRRIRTGCVFGLITRPSTSHRRAKGRAMPVRAVRERSSRWTWRMTAQVRTSGCFRTARSTA
ncbi:hypothetical protein SAMN05444004_10379 [Jannaschia faecimaris]|uniref:Uncharacterized protein n=1 Tax=Jannaschia faecimaris TaxID=1244108 RepID=A0A1H3MJ94_9RHOB|nr:hypothetical protein SAMN05444004_10379 [Jannaschia faecimaris]